MQHILPNNYLLHNRYSICRMIGQGGFGITYEAIDETLDANVCIKELFVSGQNTRGANYSVLTQNVKDFSFSDFVQRFIAEARQLAKFSHPNIVSVRDIFSANGTAYMVMEYVEGQTLKELINSKGAMTAENALPLFHQLLDAVEEVHKAGMLHRDIKPDNILITPNKHAVLIDFGSARDFIEGKTITQTAMLTPGYAPIEQYGSKKQRGAYTDIYALGATLYFLLTGTKPIDATDRYTEELPAPHLLNPNISSQLSSAVMLAMQMKPEDRFQSVEELRKGLNNLANPVNDKTIKVPKEKKEKILDEQAPIKKSNILLFSIIHFFIFFLIIGIAVIVMLLVFVFLWGNTKNKAENNNVNNSFNYEMVVVEGGTFMMGCTAEQGTDCHESEKPTQEVTLSDLKIGKYEVTQALWKTVMKNKPSGFKGCDNCPVENVNWNNVKDFIKKLNDLTGKQYRLPTEAEWEYAARGGKKSRGYKYAGSNNLNEVAWYDSNLVERFEKIGVGTKSANELGIYDMSGNVWELCTSSFKGNKNEKYDVIRGGSWRSNSQNCRVSNRPIIDHDYRSDDIGFRLVLVP